ncbi:MAG: NADP-dependent oxidoreductase [Acidobacteria bacterium]|nr:NADP-dependent oxidoreductase [Acidobacteriota bacterium]
MPTINRQWLLAARPTTRLTREHFTFAETPLPDLADGRALVAVRYLSLDPTNRGWANATATYLPPIPLGEVMRGIALGVVEQSRLATLPVGTLVQGMFGWQSHVVTDGRHLTRIDPVPGLPLDACFGLFGHIGATAYFGLIDITHPKPGETLVVSAAAGAVGSLVGQIGKILGCRVIGIAGTDDKCAWITRDLGFDEAINYRTEKVAHRLRDLCPDGVDIYFDNVGGEILDAVLGQIALRARISLCGLISHYNDAVPPPGPRYLGNLLIKRARIEGFIVLDYASRFPEAMQALGKWYMEGRLKYRVDVVEGLEHAPDALNRLFDGANTGKLLVKVS